MNEALYYLLVGSGFILIYLGYYGLRFRSVRGALPFALLMLAMAIHTLGYAFELEAASLAQMYFWVKLQYIGIVFYPLLIFRMLMRSLDDKGLYLVNRWGGSILLSVLSFLSLIGVWFYPRTSAYYIDVSAHTRNGFVHLAFNYGPLYYLQGMVLACVVVGGFLLVVNKRSTSVGANRRRMTWLAIGFLMPLLALPIHLLFRERLGADFWPLVFMPMGLMVFIALRRFDVQFLSHLTHEMLLSAIDDMVVVVDDQGVIVLMNNAAKRPGSPMTAVREGDTLDQLPIFSGLARGFMGQVDWQGRHYAVQVLEIPQGFGDLYIGRDETDSYTAKQQLLALSRTDPLTQLFNRRYMDEYLEDHQEGVIVLLDIDYFKQINDKHGHLVGDYVLLALAEALRRAFPDSLKVRYGGEEFALIFEPMALEGLCLRLEGLMRSLEGALSGYLIAKQAMDDDACALLDAVELTLSIGISHYGQQFSEGFMSADQALYASKEKGRNCIHIYTGNEILRYQGWRAPGHEYPKRPMQIG